MADQWYYERHGQQFGPVPGSEIKRLALSGDLNPDDLMWKAGTTVRRPASKLKGLFSQVASRRPPPIPPDDEPPPIPPDDKSLPIPAPIHLKGPPPLPVEFSTYFFQHFGATHCPAAMGICLGLVAIPAVSLVKPLIGFRGLCCVVAGALTLSLVGGIWYTVSRLIAYRRGQRSVARGTRSVAAPLAFGGLMFLVPIVPLVAGEFFSPPHGLLAAILPDFRKDQARWFGLEDEHPGNLTEPATSATAPAQASSPKSASKAISRTPNAQAEKIIARRTVKPPRASRGSPSKANPKTISETSEAANADAVQIRKIIDSYQKSASAAFEHDLTSVQRTEKLDSATNQLETAFRDIKAITFLSKVRDVTRVGVGRYPHRLAISIAEPEVLRLPTCRLMVGQLQVEGNEAILMQVKSGDVIAIHGNVIFAKSNGQYLQEYGPNPYCVALSIAPARRNGRLTFPGYAGTLIVPVEGGTCRIDDTTWNVLLP